MKRFILLFLILLSIYLLYNLFFSYRIVAICNEGNLKYKEGLKLTAFSRPPFSIINPLKKKVILSKIREFCISKDFDVYHSLNKYDSITHRDYFLYKRLATENSLEIKAIKAEQNIILILVTNKSNNEMELVFQLDTENDKIIGYY